MLVRWPTFVEGFSIAQAPAARRPAVTRVGWAKSESGRGMGQAIIRSMTSTRELEGHRLPIPVARSICHYGFLSATPLNASRFTATNALPVVPTRLWDLAALVAPTLHWPDY